MHDIYQIGQQDGWGSLRIWVVSFAARCFDLSVCARLRVVVPSILYEVMSDGVAAINHR